MFIGCLSSNTSAINVLCQQNNRMNWLTQRLTLPAQPYYNDVHKPNENDKWTLFRSLFFLFSFTFIEAFDILLVWLPTFGSNESTPKIKFHRITNRVTLNTQRLSSFSSINAYLRCRRFWLALNFFDNTSLYALMHDCAKNILIHTLILILFDCMCPPDCFIRKCYPPRWKKCLKNVTLSVRGTRINNSNSNNRCERIGREIHYFNTNVYHISPNTNTNTHTHKFIGKMQWKHGVCGRTLLPLYLFIQRFPMPVTQSFDSTQHNLCVVAEQIPRENDRYRKREENSPKPIPNV